MSIGSKRRSNKSALVVGLAASLETQLKMVYALTEEHRFGEAIDLVLENKTGHLRAPFSGDANHAWYVVGDIYWRAEGYSDALKAFRKALNSWRQDIEAMWAIGNCYDMLKRPRMAERYFRRALVLAPERDAIRFNLGNALYDQGKFIEAIKEYEVVSLGSSSIAESARKNIQLADKEIHKK